jgi:hypothetical protein
MSIILHTNFILYRQKIKKALFVIVCFLYSFLNAQENKSAIEHFLPHHGVSLLLSHTHVNQGYEDGTKKWLVLPSWALDYNYFFSPKWSAGLHNDMIIETFKVEDHSTDQTVVERTRPIASVAVVSFKPSKHFSYELGAGGEFAKEGNYLLTRFGLEYTLEISHTWEFVGNVIYDIKWNGYNSFAIGLGIGKSFKCRKK